MDEFLRRQSMFASTHSSSNDRSISPMMDRQKNDNMGNNGTKIYVDEGAITEDDSLLPGNIQNIEFHRTM